MPENNDKSYDNEQKKDKNIDPQPQPQPQPQNIQSSHSPIHTPKKMEISNINASIEATTDERNKKRKITQNESPNPSSPKNKLDSSIVKIDEKKKPALPYIKQNGINEIKYDLPPVKAPKDKRPKQSMDNDKNNNNKYDCYPNNINKILPYVNIEHIPKAYNKIYAPYIKNPKPKYKLDKGYNHIQSKLLIGDSINHGVNGKLPIIPNRKLSPIRKQIIKA